mgnify:CR=1 FL=1
MTNESKWLTAIGGIVAAAVPLLVAYGVFSTEQGDLWKTLAEAIVAAVVALTVPVVVVSLVKNVNDNETAATVMQLEVEKARLMAGRE